MLCTFPVNLSWSVSQKRRLLAEKAAQNASEVERAYGAEIEDDGMSGY